jgi:hypothetical protein
VPVLAAVVYGTHDNRTPSTEPCAGLTVRAPVGPTPSLEAAGFSLRVTPARRTVPRGATATYRIRVVRAHVGERAKVRVLRLPTGATATWRRSALTVSTEARQRLGSSRLVIQATRGTGRTAVHRCAVAVLTVVESHPFRIGGDVPRRLYPGSSSPVDLVLTNPNSFDLKVTALHVRAGSETSNRDCRGDANYAVAQYRGRYPLLLHPGDTRLSALAPNSSVWPRVSMHDLRTNQDACQGAVLALGYSGLATG